MSGAGGRVDQRRYQERRRASEALKLQVHTLEGLSIWSEPNNSINERQKYLKPGLRSIALVPVIGKPSPHGGTRRACGPVKQERFQICRRGALFKNTVRFWCASSAAAHKSVTKVEVVVAGELSLGELLPHRHRHAGVGFGRAYGHWYRLVELLNWLLVLWEDFGMDAENDSIGGLYSQLDATVMLFKLFECYSKNQVLGGDSGRERGSDDRRTIG
ncbi:hypothetical protein BDN70DRAFT_918605 [Pholiota conissans]|uniref:Uncharacterized protein n=1 Tax=Pholiota conissans TaxID=109636 RepID=A0A9P5ZAE8_9AGAR|nr:hypothetical protein BDN70DRAFT_918605 [Pholiota conissans]